MSFLKIIRVNDRTDIQAAFHLKHLCTTAEKYGNGHCNAVRLLPNLMTVACMIDRNKIASPETLGANLIWTHSVTDANAQDYSSLQDNHENIYRIG